MTPDPNLEAGPPAGNSDPLTPEYRKKLASDLSDAENGKRIILSVVAVFAAVFVAQLLDVGLLGGIICYVIMLYFLWGVHRRYVQAHYLNAPDVQLLHEHGTRRKTTGLALGCAGGLFAIMATLILAVVVVAFVFAATAPDEQKMRTAVFGQLGRGLEQLGDLSGALGGPKIVYKDYVFGSILAVDYGKGAEPDILAVGACGRVWLTDEVKKLHDRFAPSQ